MKKLFISLLILFSVCSISHSAPWSLSNPGEDKLMGWDNSAEATQKMSWFGLANGLAFSGTNIVPTYGTTASTFAEGNHTHTGVYQAYDADLSTYAGITPADNVQSILGAANYDIIKVLLGLTIGTDIQSYSAVLDDVATPGVAGTYLKSTGTGVIWDVAGGAGGGTIGGTVGSVDNVIPRTDGTDGLTLQNSLMTLSDAGSPNIPSGQTYNINGSAHTHNYQVADADLTTYAGITPSANVQSVLGAADYSAIRTLLTLVPGTDVVAVSAIGSSVQAYDADLTTWAGVTPSDNGKALVALANYAAMLSAIGAQATDADLTALAGLSGVRGDIVYRDATQWQRLGKGTAGQYLVQGADDPAWTTSAAADADIIALAAISGVRGDVIVRGAETWERLAKGAEGTVLKMTATDPTWGTDNNDGGAGISTWDELGDSAADATIALAGYKTIFSSTLNTAGANWTMTNTTADLTSDVSFFDMKLTDDGDTNGYFMRGYDNAGNDLKWSIGPEGAYYGFSFETVQSATGGVLDLLEGSGAGTDYIRIKADDDVGTNRKFAFSSSVADSEDLTIQLGANDNTVTIGSSTGVSSIGFGTIGITTTGSLAATGSRVTKGWFTDIESTNIPSVGGSPVISSLTAPVFSTSIEAPFVVLGSAATAADAGTIRMPNAGSIQFEADAAGTDVNALSVDASEVVQIAASGASGVTITPNTTITGDLTVGGADITLKTDGVKLTGSNGSLTILGLGDGQDEDVKIDLNTTANQITVSSPASSATAVSLSALNLVTTGTISGAIPSTTDANGQTLSAAQQYGYVHWATGAGTTNLVTAVAGMSLVVYSTTAAAVVINPADADVITLNGTALSAGDSITSASGAGDFIALVSHENGKWVTMGRSGVWTDSN